MDKLITIKKWGLAIAIVIVFNLFVNYGIATFYKGPEYNDFCIDKYPRIAPAKGPGPYDCDALIADEALQKNCTEQKGYIAYEYDSNGCPAKAYCETCGARFEEVNGKYNANVFIALVAIGVAALIAGILIKADAVGSGFLFGGVVSIFIGAIRYWGQLHDVARFSILGIVLALLVWIGYRKLK